PILSQNYGAGQIDRVRQTIVDSMIASAVYVAVMWLLLALLNPVIIMVFSATGDAADIVWFFCVFATASFIFMAALFVANAAFNNLDYPYLSTVFNWGRATLGVIPFVYVAQSWGPMGVLAGWSLGGVVFGAMAIASCFAVLKKLPERAAREGITVSPPPSANSPFTSGKGALFGRIDTEQRY
ncbi:MAG: MATE family efflux transporter, partial [Rhizobiaceae bacterium]